MAELLVDFITSLDGYGAAEGWPGWWGLEGPEYLDWLQQRQDDSIILMGANTYRLMFDLAKGGQPGTDVLEDRAMTTQGSLALCRALLAAGLVDRFRVGIFPVITGRTGRDRIYDGYPDVALDLVQSRTFDGRIQLLEYIPRVLSGPPGTAEPGPSS